LFLASEEEHEGIEKERLFVLWYPLMNSFKSANSFWQANREVSLTGIALELTYAGQSLVHHCREVKEVCRAQRESLAVQRIGLRLRAVWHDLPKDMKRPIHAQWAMDRAAKRLVDSIDPD
jgi:hypothetical protein